MYSRRRSSRPSRRFQTAARRQPPSSLRRQAFGNFAAAMQQRDSTNIVATLQEDVAITIPTGCNEGTIVRNAHALLCTSQYFRNYMGMYDQYKINAVRASIEALSLDGAISGPSKFPSVCTAWDRNGVQIKTVNIGSSQAPQYAFTLPTYDEVTSYSSSNEKTIYYGSRWGVIRQLDAASMQEKSMYIPTSQTKDVLSYGNIYSVWNPCLLLSIKAPVAITQTTDSNIFSIHWQFDITLRGLRKLNTDDTTISLYKPYPGFVGYYPNNSKMAVATFGNKNVYAVSGSADATLMTINPSVSAGTEAGQLINNSLSIPNTGLPHENINMAV